MEIENATVVKGLLSTPKYFPHWYMYDTRGSILFDNAAMNNPHYHIYGNETRILKQNIVEIISNVGNEVVLCELGAGSSTKTTHIISALLQKNKQLTYIPIDVAKEFVEDTSRGLLAQFNNGLEVKPFAGNYIEGLCHLKTIRKEKLIIFLGNSFSNIPLHEMRSFLSHLKDAMGDNGRFLAGIDTTQDEDTLRAMYTDPHTSVPFALNCLTRLNREFEANFKLEMFRLNLELVVRDGAVDMVDNPRYIQIALKSTCKQDVNLEKLGLHMSFEADELMYVHELESLSLKWTWDQFEDTMAKGGLCLQKKWSDESDIFGLVLMESI
uniref:Uncharacterized protein LOC100372749 n=1 Tax=Saccoglossus kowalevskii TaxID=10224 RepID=A0ABM0H1F8_SACKO|nr:PREDICTED: uncharacterized protein LOC100372749 [Saccoglossus kowalevskii]